MHRRKFFNFLGAATLGTIIALKLPDTIAPIKLWIEKPKITFTALMEAYRKCCIGNKEPNCIVLSRNDFKDASDSIKEHARFTYRDLPFAGKHMGYKFMNADLISTDMGVHGHFIKELKFGEVKDGEIEVYGSTYGTCGRFEFV